MLVDAVLHQHDVDRGSTPEHNADRGISINIMLVKYYLNKHTVGSLQSLSTSCRWSTTFINIMLVKYYIMLIEVVLHLHYVDRSSTSPTLC